MPQFAHVSNSLVFVSNTHFNVKMAVLTDFFAFDWFVSLSWSQSLVFHVICGQKYD